MDLRRRAAGRIIQTLITSAFVCFPAGLVPDELKIYTYLVLDLSRVRFNNAVMRISRNWECLWQAKCIQADGSWINHTLKGKHNKTILTSKPTHQYTWIKKKKEAIFILNDFGGLRGKQQRLRTQSRYFLMLRPKEYFQYASFFWTVSSRDVGEVSVGCVSFQAGSPTRAEDLDNNLAAVTERRDGEVREGFLCFWRCLTSRLQTELLQTWGNNKPFPLPGEVCSLQTTDCGCQVESVHESLVYEHAGVFFLLLSFQATADENSRSVTTSLSESKSHFVEIHRVEIRQEAQRMDSLRCAENPQAAPRAFDILLENTHTPERHLIIATEHGRWKTHECTRFDS